MQTRRLGRSGLTVSRLGLGTLTWGRGVDDDGAREQLSTFVEAGGTLVDTAHSYGDGQAETWLGGFLGTVVPRQDLVIVTKAGLVAGPTGALVDPSRRALLAGLEESLRRLRTDHVDLWLAHAWCPDVPLEETIGALEYAARSGRARYVGVSNFGGWQVARAFSLLERAGVPLVADEVELSLVAREAEQEVLPAAAELGFGVLAWAPLGHGVLTGKYRGSMPPQSRATSRHFPGFVQRFLDTRSVALTDALVTAARGLDVPPAHVALAWVRDLPEVGAALVGARTPTQLLTALHSEQLVLPAQIRAALDDISG